MDTFAKLVIGGFLGIVFAMVFNTTISLILLSTGIMTDQNMSAWSAVIGILGFAAMGLGFCLPFWISNPREERIAEKNEEDSPTSEEDPPTFSA